MQWPQSTSLWHALEIFRTSQSHFLNTLVVSFYIFNLGYAGKKMKKMQALWPTSLLFGSQSPLNKPRAAMLLLAQNSTRTSGSVVSFTDRVLCPAWQRSAQAFRRNTVNKKVGIFKR